MTPSILGVAPSHGHTTHFAEAAGAAEAQGKHHEANVFELLLLQDLLHRHGLGAESAISVSIKIATTQEISETYG